MTSGMSHIRVLNMAYWLAAGLPHLAPGSANWILHCSLLKCVIRVLVSALPQSVAWWYRQRTKVFSRLFQVTGVKSNWECLWITILHVKLARQNKFVVLLIRAYFSAFSDQNHSGQRCAISLCQLVRTRRTLISISLLMQMWVGRVIAVLTWNTIALTVFKALFFLMMSQVNGQ